MIMMMLGRVAAAASDFYGVGKTKTQTGIENELKIVKIAELLPSRRDFVVNILNADKQIDSLAHAVAHICKRHNNRRPMMIAINARRDATSSVVGIGKRICNFFTLHINIYDVAE